MSAPPGSSHRKIRVLLVDDHRIVREGLAAQLGTGPDLEVVAAGRAGLNTFRLLIPDVSSMGREFLELAHAGFF